jgi:hypothetical protein
MAEIRSKKLLIINLIFAFPIAVLLVSYGIAFLGRIFEILYAAYTPIFVAYYLAPFIGWVSIIPIITSALSLKTEKNILLKIFSLILIVVYFTVLVYIGWWWITGQKFQAI